RVVRTRTAILMGSIVVQAIAIVLCGLLRDFYVVVGLYLVYGVALGVAMPVKAAYLNAHIPSARRATILPLEPCSPTLGGAAARGTPLIWAPGTRSTTQLRWSSTSSEALLSQLPSRIATITRCSASYQSRHTSS